MIRMLAVGGLSAVALLVVLATSVPSTGLVRCHTSQAVMPAPCCRATSGTDASTVSTAPPCCCEDMDPAVAVVAIAAIAPGKCAHSLPHPGQAIVARLDERLHSSSPCQRQLIERLHEAALTSRRPAYEQYCSYLL